jgi:hypothetical protein
MNRVQVGLVASLGSIDDGLCYFGWTERLLIAAHNVRECSATNPNKTDFNRDVQKQKMAPV